MTQPTCETCKWVRVFDGKYGRPKEVPNHGGECWRYPPIPNPNGAPDYRPLVDSRDYCGEHTPAEKAKEGE